MSFSKGLIVKFTFAALLATVFSMSIIAFVGLIGVEVADNSSTIQIDKSRIYTEEDVKSAARETMDIINEKIEADRLRSETFFFDEARSTALFLIWVPWFLVALLLKIDKFSVASLMVVPAIFVAFFGVFTLIDLVVFLAASNLAVLLRWPASGVPAKE